MPGEKIAVLGAGTMGRGIAQVFAQSGFQTKLFDIAPAALEGAVQTIDKMLSKAVEKGKMSSDDAQAAKNNLTTETSMSDLGHCDLIVEAATEKPDIKTKILADAQEYLSENGILASNTSSISITQLAAGTETLIVSSVCTFLTRFL